MENKWHPLPANYGDLAPEGQKQARLAVLTDQSTPEKLVQAWNLFRNLYLKTRGQSFYRGGFVASPDFHFQAIEDLGRFARNVLAAPRGSAKSTVIGKEIILFLLLTRPFFSIVLCMATDRLIEARFDDIMVQLTENPLILHDFGEQKPRRGEAIWNHHHLHLTNGSVLEGFSVTGRKRGARPQLFILDDPEYDPETDSITAAMLVIEKFERFMFRQVIPMLEHGSGIFWIGTMINRRTFLYHACCGDDPRFAFWNRRVLTSLIIDPEDSTKSKALWGERWSKEILETRRAEMGVAAFEAEFQNNPISDEARVLAIDPWLNEYKLEEPLQWNDIPNLFASGEKVKWHVRSDRVDHIDGDIPDMVSGNFVEKEQTIKEWLAGMFRLIAVDYAIGLKQTNDYKCIAVLGFDRQNVLWLLDLWMGRVKDSNFLSNIYKMGQQWRVKIIGVEATGIQISLVDSVTEYVEKAADVEKAWRPRVVPVRYPTNCSKPERISGLEWRFRAGRIKYPSHLKKQWPFNALYAQTLDFTPDLALLRFDDAIDTVAMSQYIVHAKGTHLPTLDRTPTLADRIRTDEPLAPGLPHLSGIDIRTISQEVVAALIDKANQDRYNKMSLRRQRFKIHRPNIVAGYRRDMLP